MKATVPHYKFSLISHRKCCHTPCPGQFFKYIFGFFGPHQALWIRVVLGNVVRNRLFQLLYTVEHPIPDSIAGDVSKPTLNNVQPRTTRRCKVDMKSLVPLQPVSNLWMLVSSVVIDNQV